MKLRLHTRYQNSAGQRVRIVFNLKRVPYEYVAISSLSSDTYRKLNPQGLMPTLEIDGRVVAQSMAIIELLEEIFPEPSVFPRDPILRGESRWFALMIAADLHPINNNRVRRCLTDVLGADDIEVRAWYHHWVREAFSSLEALLAGRSAHSDSVSAANPDWRMRASFLRSTTHAGLNAMSHLIRIFWPSAASWTNLCKPLQQCSRITGVSERPSYGAPSY